MVKTKLVTITDISAIVKEGRPDQRGCTKPD